MRLRMVEHGVGVDISSKKSSSKQDMNKSEKRASRFQEQSSLSTLPLPSFPETTRYSSRLLPFLCMSQNVLKSLCYLSTQFGRG